jgi:YesN/AraC family two-component response regulator
MRQGDAKNNVEKAHHGSEALRVALQHPGPIDLLLTDMVMPLMGGKLLAEKMIGLRPGLKVHERQRERPA